MSDAAPETSIIIRAMNEERWLPDVFAALDIQKYRDFEVLLVDSGSVDRTRDIGAANGARIVRLRTEDFTFGHSLNVGIEEARGKFMAIISAHAIPADADWLEGIIAPLRRDDVAMVYGGQRGHEQSKFSEWKDFNRVFPKWPKPVKNPAPFANNANSSIKKELWHQHRFNEMLPGLEDIEWAKHWMEEGLKVAYEPNATVIHIHTETWPQVRRRYQREAIAARWINVRLLRHIPVEIARELIWCAGDLRTAFRQRRLLELTGQILRFRYEKTVGTVWGIISSKAMKDPRLREEMFGRQEFRALVARAPGNVAIEERFVPGIKPGEVLVRVSHVGLSSADIDMLDRASTTFPIVPGHELSGTIVSVGPRPTALVEGDRVVVESNQGCGECAACKRDEVVNCRESSTVGQVGRDGGCAEYFVTRARYVHKIPDNVPLEAAWLVEPLAFVLKGLRRLGAAAATNAKRCVVIGAGTVGHLVTRVLAARGHTVRVIDLDQRRLDALADVASTSKSIDGLEGADWLIEATGRHTALTQLLERAPSGATLLLLGLPYEGHRTDFEAVVTRDGAVIGSVGSSSRDFKEALQLLPALDTSAFAQARFPLSRYSEALAVARSGAALKVVLMTESAA
jgi:threonine dehydrogenase-like Zn-dependent dehydrogenase/glycosyltransferase involved in cell wall biosynthesis